MTASRSAAVALALLGCTAAVATHLAALHGSGLDPVSTPIGALARTAGATPFQYGLLLFALGHLALAFLLNRPNISRLTRAAQFSLALDAVLIVWLAWHFATVPAPAPESAIDARPLWFLGGAAGFAMSFVAVALWRRHRDAALWTLVCVLLWIVLAPVFLMVDPSWIGAYQRFVGAVLIAWIAVLAVMIRLRER